MRHLDLGRGGRPLRIGYGRIFHEANAFSPLLTTQADFERLHALEGVALERAAGLGAPELLSFMPHAELTGFRQAALLAGNIHTIPLFSAMSVPGGPLSEECFAWLLDRLLSSIERAGYLDGVYLALHGSMQVNGLDEPPEAVILRKTRALLGPQARVAVSYDLHANLSSGLVEPADVLIAYRSNPHWDLAPTGFRAGNRLIRTLRGQCAPVHSWRKLPLLLGGGVTIDFLPPMRGVFRWMKQLEADPRVLSASLFMVHPYTTAEELGWATHVCTDGDERLAASLAEQLADRAWAQRHKQPPPALTPAEALDQVASSRWRKLGPITLVDGDDIVGAGAPGGNTHIAQELVRNDRGLNVLVPIHDPALVEELWNLPTGTQRQVTLRGTPNYGMPEVTLDAKIGGRTEGEMGRTIRLDVGSFHLAISDAPPLPIHPSYWSKLGLDARKADAVVQKNFFHYRMFYLTTSFHHLLVKSGGATSLERVRSRNTRIPCHPGVALADWRISDPALRQGRAGIAAPPAE